MDFYITPEEYKAAEKNGINSKYLDKRVRQLGWCKEKAINTPIRKMDSRKEWAKIAESNGIKYHTFVGRINHYGWSMERAATEPLIKSKGAKRKYPKELVVLAEKNGISYQTFLKRISRGMDQYKAATTPVISQSEAGRIGKSNAINYLRFYS